MRHTLTFAVLLMASAGWASLESDALTSVAALNANGKHVAAATLLRTIALDALTSAQATQYSIQCRRSSSQLYLRCYRLSQSGGTMSKIAATSRALDLVLPVDQGSIRFPHISPFVIERYWVHAGNAARYITMAKEKTRFRIARKAYRKSRSETTALLHDARYEDDPVGSAESALASFAVVALSLPESLLDIYEGDYADLEQRFAAPIRRRAAEFKDSATTSPMNGRNIRGLRRAYVKLSGDRRTRNGSLAKTALARIRSVTTETLIAAPNKNYFLDLVAIVPTAAEKRRIFDAVSGNFQGGRLGYMRVHVLRHEKKTTACIAVARALDDSLPSPEPETRTVKQNYEVWALYEALQSALIAGRTDDAIELVGRMEVRAPRDYYTGISIQQLERIGLR